MDAQSDEIVLGMARILWGMAWADAMEEAGCSNVLSGRDILEIMPPIPGEAYAAAWRLVGAYEVANQIHIWSLYAKAMAAQGRRGHESPGYDDQARRFGECLAFEALGTGVNWADDHKAFEHIAPYAHGADDLRDVAARVVSSIPDVS